MITAHYALGHNKAILGGKITTFLANNTFLGAINFVSSPKMAL